MTTSLGVIEFDYNMEALQNIVKDLSQINKESVEEVDGAVKQLVKIRRAIQAKGKTYRDDANAFNKSVIAKENEYVAVVEPLEIEYKDILEKVKQKQIIDARIALLPNKKKQLALLKITQPTDEEILSMDEAGWVAFFDVKYREHENNVANEEKMAKAEEERKQREEKIKADAIKNAEADKIKAVEQAKKDAELKALRDKQEAEDKIRREKEREEAAKREKERQEAQEKARIEADKKYQEFLSVNQYNPVTDIIQKNGSEVKIYRIVSTFIIK